MIWIILGLIAVGVVIWLAVRSASRSRSRQKLAGEYARNVEVTKSIGQAMPIEKNAENAERYLVNSSILFCIP